MPLNNFKPKHWRIQGRGRSPPPLFLDQIEALWPLKNFRDRPLLFSKGLDDRPPPLISNSGSGSSKFVAFLSLPVWHFLLVEGLRNLLFSAALSERNFVVSILRQTKVYELITRLSDDK